MYNSSSFSINRDTNFNLLKNILISILKILETGNPSKIPFLECSTINSLIEQPNFQWYPKISFEGWKKFFSSRDSLFLPHPPFALITTAGRRNCRVFSHPVFPILVSFSRWSRRFNGFPPRKRAWIMAACRDNRR